MRFSRFQVLRIGRSWLLMSLLLLVIGWLRGINVVLLLAYLLLVLWLLNFFLAGRGLGRLQGRRRMEGPIFARTPCTLSGEVVNPWHRDQIGIQLADRGTGLTATWLFLVQLRRHESVRFAREVTLPRRGRFRWQALSATSGYPFGLVRRSVDLVPAEDIIVLPQLGRLHRGRLRRFLTCEAAMADGLRSWPRPVVAAHAEFHGLRPYRSGDSFRCIHWRTSARRGELMVRESENATTDNLVLVFDPWVPAPSQVGDSGLEAMASLAATICWEWCRQRGERFALAVGGPRSVVLDGVTGPDHARRMLECLALVEWHMAKDAGPLMEALAAAKLPPGSLLVVSLRARPSWPRCWRPGYIVARHAWMPPPWTAPISTKGPAPMRLDSAFRLSSYLTLGMACACLGYAAQPFLPEVAYLIVPVTALLLVAYFVEGRWSMTDLVTNLVATPIIAAGVGIWAAYRLTEPAHGPAEGMVFLVLMGSFLTILMLAKLFRPKRDRDFWFLHFTAFIAVAISCALDSDLVFGFLLLAYLACGIWSVALFHLAANHAAARPNTTDLCLTASPFPADGDPVVPWRILGLGQAAGRAVLVAAAALVLFLLTPRLGTTHWDGSLLDLPQLQTLAVDPGMDINRTGTVRLSKTVAFEVSAEDARGEPKLDLSPNQRWRGSALNTYARGRCFNRAALLSLHGEAPLPPTGKLPLARPDDTLPDLGPQQYFLTFTFAHRPLHRVCLAEPVIFTPPAGRLPVVFLTGGGQPAPVAQHLNSEVPPPSVDRRQKCSYRQALAPVPESGLTPAVDVEKLLEGPLAKPPDVPGLREWTTELLARLVEEGKLQPAEIEEDLQGDLFPENHERVARALEAHLAMSGEYTYTLKLSRHDLQVDPALDFLRDVKEGHCQRFAVGLTVMLRSLGVPARIVVGYHGAEHRGGGTYQVRQCDAHSWVEVLVRRPPSGDDPQWYWLTLDPTPSSDADADRATGWFGWWRLFRTGGGEMWRSFVIDYNAEQQEAAVLGLWRFAGGDPFRQGPGEERSPQGKVFYWGRFVLAGLGALLVAWLFKRLRSCSAPASLDGFLLPGGSGLLRPAAGSPVPPLPTWSEHRPNAARVRRGSPAPSSPGR